MSGCASNCAAFARIHAAAIQQRYARCQLGGGRQLVRSTACMAGLLRRRRATGANGPDRLVGDHNLRMQWPLA